VLIFVSDFLRNYGIYLLIGIILAIVGFVYWLKDPDNRRVSIASSCVCRCSAPGAWIQHRALHPHLQHPDGQRRCRCWRPCASPVKWSPIYPCATP
jgi:hypothetical protein